MIDVQFAADMTRLAGGMQAMQGQINGVLDGVGSKAREAMGQFESAIGFAKTALIGLVGVASVGAFAGMIKSSIDAQGALHDLSTQTGASVAALGAFKGIGVYTETSIEQITGAMGKLSKGMSSAGEESKGIGIALKALGINFDEFKSLAPEDRMLAVAKAMGEFKDGSDKSAAAMMIFGKEGAKLLPFLKDLAEQHDEVKAKLTDQEKETRRLQAAMADAFGDNLTAIRKQSDGWKKDLATGLMPALYEASKAVLDMAGGTGGLKDQISKLAKDGTLAEWARGAMTALSYVVDVGQGLLSLIPMIGKVIAGVAAGSSELFGGIFAAMGKIKDGDFTGAWDELKRGFAGVKSVAADTGKDIADIWGQRLLGATFRERMADLKGTQAAVDGNKQSLQDLARMAEEMEKRRQAEAAAAKEAADEQRRLNAENERAVKAGYDLKAAIERKNIELQKQIELGRDLTPVEKKLIELDQDLSSGKVRMTPNVEELTRAEIARGGALEEEARQAKESIKATEDAIKAAEKNLQAVSKQTAAQEECNAKIGMTNEQLADYEVKADLAKAATLRNIAANTDFRDASIAATLKDEADQWEKLARLKGEAFDKKAAAEAANTWKGTFQSISEGLYDALLKGGSSAWDYIKNLIKDTVLRMTVLPVIQQGVGMIGGFLGNMLGVSGMASGAGQMMSGGAGLFSTGVSAFNAIDTLASGSAIGTALFGNSAAYGAAIGTANIGAGSQAAMLAAQTGEFGAAGAAATSSAAAGAGTGAASWMASLGPYAIAAIVLYALLSDHSKWSMGSVAEGQFGADGSFSNAQLNLPYQFGNNTEHERDAKLQRGVVDLLGSTITGAAESLGGTGPNGLALSLTTDTDREGKVAALIGLLSGNTLIGGVQTGTGSFSGTPGQAAAKIPVEELQKFFSDAMPQIVVQGLQQSDLPARFHDFFNSVDAAGLTKDKAEAMLATASAVNTITESLRDLGGPFAKLGSLSVDAAASLIKMNGGLESFLQKTSSYVQQYYTEGEQMSLSAKSVLKTLADAGLDGSGATSKSQLRQFMDTLDPNKEADRVKMTALLDVASQFATLGDYLQKQGVTLGELANAAPQVSALQQLQSPTEATATNTAATATNTTEIAGNTKETTTAVAELKDTTDAQTDTLAEGFKRMLAALDKMQLTLLDIQRDLQHAEAAG